MRARADEQRGIDHLRVLADGRELAVIVRIFNTILTIGPAGANTYDDQW